MKQVLTYLFIISFGVASAQIDSLRHYYKQGIAAYENQDYSGFLNHMKTANEFRALYPPIIYNIGAGYALNGQRDSAVFYLKTYLTMNASVNFQSDSDFEPIKGTPAFQSAIELSQQLNKKIITSQHHLTIDATDHIESIAINEKDKTLFLGDVHSRKVYSYRNKELKVLASPINHPDIFCVMGLDFDEKRQKLWICTAALPQMTNYTDSLEGVSSVFSFDLETKQLNHHGTLRGGQVFGDLIVSRAGQVFISDGGANKIYTVSADQKLQVFADLSSQTYNLQGLTLNEKEDALFISDYIMGLFKLEFNSMELSRLTFAEGIPFKGLDGIYYHRNTILGLQNGTKPIRSVQFFLNPDQTSISNYTAYDQNVDYLDEPTQGFIDKTHFFYITNSPWAKYDENNELESATPTVLRKIILK